MGLGDLNDTTQKGTPLNGSWTASDERVNSLTLIPIQKAVTPQYYIKQ
jgi:hypothetical protein